MEFPPKMVSAMNAMKAIGFSWETTRPVLEDLLKVYENWDHIESENYRVLADAIIDSLESEDGGLKKKKKKHHEAGVDKKDNVEHDSFRQKKAKPGQDAYVDRGPIHERVLDKKLLQTGMKKRKTSKSLCLSDAQIGQPDTRGTQSSIAERSGQIKSAQPSSTYELNDIGLFQESCGSGKIQNLPCVKGSLLDKGSTSSFIADGKDKLAVHKVLDTSVRCEEPQNEYKRKASATVINRPAEYKASQLGEPISSMKRGKECSLHDHGKNASSNVDKSVQNSSSKSMCLFDAQIGQPIMRGAQSSIEGRSRQIKSAQPSSAYGLNGLGLFQQSRGSVKIQTLPCVEASMGENVRTSSFKADGKDKLAVHEVLNTSVRCEEPKNENKRKGSATVINRPAEYKASQLGEPISSTCSPRPLPDRIIGTRRGKGGSLHDIVKNASSNVDKSVQISSSMSMCISDAQIGQTGMRGTQSSTVERSGQIKSAQPSSAYVPNGIGLFQECRGSGKIQILPCAKGSVTDNCSTSSFISDVKDKLEVHKVLNTSVRCEEPKNENKRMPSAIVINRPAECKASKLREPISSTCSPRPLPDRIVGTRRVKEGPLQDHGKNASSNGDKSVQNSSSINIELASSTSGEVRIMVLYDPALPCPNFRMPSMEFLCKMMEDRCLKSYKILEPHFSLLSLLKEMCHCVMELCSKSSEEHINIDIIRGMNPVNGQSDYMNLKTYCNNQRETGRDTGATRRSGAVTNDSLSFSRHSSINTKIVAVGDTDICRGEENVKISLANVPNAERYPPSFHYIARNVVYQNAYVNISLARIGDEDCCSTCSGDCLASSIPCPCARETGGDYAYTSEGLMKREFLDAIISMKSNQLKQHLYFCIDCPIERIKNEMMPEPCKGHLLRKFVKECWNKCGCNRICGNRLVQRGITRNLQVFWTAERKGWGLRTLKELPIGAFICEYVGEILTNTELSDRQLHVTGKMRHTYPVLLDADWGSEQILKDEEALCLDATFYGNVARFINHRCADANIVDVPVEIETPDHHYYHLAFFTVRKVDALEELTWDYGIDFDDHTHPIKAFSCHCGSKFCRDRSQIRKRSALVLR